MLEWMHDQEVVENLRTDFLSKTLQDCENFIISSQNTEHHLNLAITDENDCYMGTVSLKNITEKNAEFGITVRKSAMGSGYAKSAMDEILKIGFEQLHLEQIYWCVAPENKRAVRFYDKNGYQRTEADRLPIKGEYSREQIASYLWYLKECKNH